MNAEWYRYLLYNHIKHFWRNSVVDRLNRHGIHWISFSDERIKHYAGRQITDRRALNNLIAEKIRSGVPFMVSRLGGCETRYTTAYIGDNRKAKEIAIKELTTNAGFFPCEIEWADRYAKLYLDSVSEIDICGIWRYYMEDYVLHRYAPGAVLTILERLEPWRADADTIPWTTALRGKRVLVIHPFSDSIEMQYHKKRTKLFANQNRADEILPEMELITLKAVQSMGGKGSPLYNNWFDALDDMIRKVDTIDFDVAIIGCGAYGMPLAAHIKQIGKQAIHLGGATQLMFGIMGKRWDHIPEIHSLVNENWVRPMENETPKCSNDIEAGCYW